MWSILITRWTRKGLRGEAWLNVGQTVCRNLASGDIRLSGYATTASGQGHPHWPMFYVGTSLHRKKHTLTRKPDQDRNHFSFVIFSKWLVRFLKMVIVYEKRHELFGDCQRIQER